MTEGANIFFKARGDEHDLEHRARRPAPRQNWELEDVPIPDDDSMKNPALTREVKYLRHNMWDHIRKTNAIVREKLATLLTALDDNLGDMISCIPPTGGLFAWTSIPDDTDMGQLMAGLDERQVRCTRGQAFRVDQQDIPNIRFSFAYPSVDDIRDGVEVFADCVRAAQPSVVGVS